MSELKSSGKPFDISKQEVWEAWEKVRAKKGAPGVDGCSIEDFEADLKNQLYKVWNRMSSGSYFPPPVRAVEIPKPHGGGTRILGVPTVADRVAQTVVARRLGRKVEAIFHQDSYGYRPGRSPQDAVEACRRRCWKRDWVIDLDIQKFFDTVPWDLVVKAVEAMLANLFLHYAFDAWMAREFPGVAFERYVDDAVVHCVSESQARMVLAAIAERMEQVGLRLHPDKTRIVYCQDGRRRASYEHTEFTYLGFTFRQRRARAKSGRQFNSFLPAISKNALKKINAEVQSWRLYNRTGQDLADVARDINPVVRGWMEYYGAFYRSAMYPLLSRINAYLVRWIRKKYKRLRAKKKAFRCWRGIVKRCPRMFAHWIWVPSVPSVW